MGGRCNVLLMADRVIREDNGKRGIIGSFNTFNFPCFPFVAPPFFIYANLDDFSGEYEFSVTIAREGAELVIFSAGGEIKLENEREAEILIPAFSVSFPKEGTYNLILRIGNSLYGSRRIIVNRVQYSAYANQEPRYADNISQEIVIRPESDGREYMLASERALMSVWATPEEDEAWKDL